MQSLIFSGIFPVTAILVFRYVFPRFRNTSRYDWIGSKERWSLSSQKQGNTLTSFLSLMLEFLIKVLPPTYHYFHINHTVDNLHFCSCDSHNLQKQGKYKSHLHRTASQFTLKWKLAFVLGECWRLWDKKMEKNIFFLRVVTIITSWLKEHDDY